LRTRGRISGRGRGFEDVEMEDEWMGFMVEEKTWSDTRAKGEVRMLDAAECCCCCHLVVMVKDGWEVKKVFRVSDGCGLGMLRYDEDGLVKRMRQVSQALSMQWENSTVAREALEFDGEAVTWSSLNKMKEIVDDAFIEF